MNWFESLTPVMQAILATTFTWAVTALGALIVCFFKEMNGKILDTILGFSAGVMIAASFWSLIAPAIDLSGRTWLHSLVATSTWLCARRNVCINIRWFLRQDAKSKKQLKKFNIFKKKYTFNICYNYSQHTRRNGSWSSLWRNCK